MQYVVLRYSGKRGSISLKILLAKKLNLGYSKKETLPSKGCNMKTFIICHHKIV